MRSQRGVMQTDRFFGEAWLMELHQRSGQALLPLVVLHWFWLAYASYRYRENLPAAMWHGRKPLRPPQHRIGPPTPNQRLASGPRNGGGAVVIPCGGTNQATACT